METNGPEVYRCIKSTEKDGAPFVAGKTYQRRLQSNTGVNLDKDGGGIVNFSDSEMSEFFVPVKRVTCTTRLEQGDITFRKDQVYYMDADTSNSYIIFYGSTVGDEMTLTSKTFQNHFRVCK